MKRRRLPRSPAARVVIAATAASCGWLSWRAWLAVEQLRASDWVDAMGGYAEWEPTGWEPEGPGMQKVIWKATGYPLFHDLVGIGFAGSPAIPPEDLRLLRGLPRLKRLGLGLATVADDHLAALPRLRRLEELSLSQSAVTDAGLDALPQAVPRLRELDLTHVAATDAKVAELRAKGIAVAGRP